MVCKKCGNNINMGARFCKKCGASIEYENVQTNNVPTGHKNFGIIIAVLIVCIIAACVFIVLKNNAAGSKEGGNDGDGEYAGEGNFTKDGKYTGYGEYIGDEANSDNENGQPDNEETSIHQYTPPGGEQQGVLSDEKIGTNSSTEDVNEKKGKYQYLLESDAVFMVAGLKIEEEKDDYYLVRTQLYKYPIVSRDELRACFDSNGEIINDKITLLTGEELTLIKSVTDDYGWEWNTDIENDTVMAIDEEGECRLIQNCDRCEAEFMPKGYTEVNVVYLDLAIVRDVKVLIDSNIELKLKKNQIVELLGNLPYVNEFGGPQLFDEFGNPVTVDEFGNKVDAYTKYTAQEAYSMSRKEFFGNGREYLPDGPIANIKFDKDGFITRYKEDWRIFTE